MRFNYRKEAGLIAEEIKSVRRKFHMEPELGNKEFKTAERIERYLTGLGIKTRRILGTAVVGVLDGMFPGPSIALRADMDALPITEDTDVSFSSVSHGVMHACGHDVHIAAALGAAKLISAHRDELHGRLTLLFQPDEEGNGGALRMIEKGAIDGVSAIFGAHVTPDLPLGHVGIRYGKFYAASETFRVTVNGRSAHGAERAKGIDALAAAAKMVSDVLRVPCLLPHGEYGVVSVGTFHAGTAINIIPGSAEFTGIIRALGTDTRALIAERLKSEVMRIAGDFGVKAECELHESYPGVVNNDEMTCLVQETACDLFGVDFVHVIDMPTMTTEDFGYFLHHVPGSFYHIGAGCELPLHNSKFLPNDDAAITAATLHAAVVTRAMEILN